jgi:hypothetical protein
VRLPGLPPEVFQHPQLAGRIWTLKRRIAGQHTDLLELHCPPDAGRIFIKQLRRRPGEGPDWRLRREYRALRVLQSRLGPGLERSLPTALGVHENDTLLVVRGVDGVPLTDLLRRDANRLTGWWRRARLAAAGAAVGTWLRLFHAATARAPLTHDHERFCEDLSSALQRLGAKAGVDGLDDVRQRLAHASARLKGMPLQAAARHGDFLPQNILVSAAGVGVVDFENYRSRETVHRDVGYMLAYTMLLRRNFGYLPGALDTFGRAFASSYGDPAFIEAQRLFTAESAVRIARDSPRPRTVRALFAVVAALVPQQQTQPEAGTAR